jgi:polysaccharide pyruvyl transferase CsaB
MRVVISGYFGHGNLGDEAVLAGMLSSMRAADPAIEATVISGDPTETRRTHSVEAVPRMAPLPIWRALRRADGLISGGGGLLQDRTSARPVPYYTGVMGLARLAGRPYVVHAQGLGPIARRPNRTIAAAALRGASHVSLRDEASIGLARELGVRRPIELVPDPSIALRPTRTEGDHVLVAVRRWGRSDEHLVAIRTALGTLAREHPIVAMPMQEPFDRDASTFAVDGVVGARVAPGGTSLEERMALIGSARLVVGMRLHALVLAAAAGVPAVAITYDPKVDAFASRVGMPVAGDVDGRLEPARIVEAARKELAADLAERHRMVEAMREELTSAAARSLAALSGRANAPE